METYDLAVIGAGPAGLAAAAEASAAGLSVVLLDEQPRPGGQIYREVDRAASVRGAILGKDYTHGLSLTGAAQAENVTYMSGTTVWDMTPEGVLSFTRNGAAGSLRFERLLIATGALERPMPVPGWTLPGVMAAGAAQILLKQSGLVSRRAVLAGSGPLLYLVAAQMVRAGSAPLALLETQGQPYSALRYAPRALMGWRVLGKGMRLLAELRRAGVPRYRGVRAISIEGEGQVNKVRFEEKGRTREISCDTVFLHHGVVPNVQASRALRLDHDWCEAQACFQPRLDDWGRSSARNIFIAGDGAGIGGAIAAEHAGRLTALEIARDLGAIEVDDRDRRAAPIRRALLAERAVRPFLDAAFPPYSEAIADDTIICRCEEVTAGAIRRAASLGCAGPNQSKAFNRAGMGPCQGRYCGLTVSKLLAEVNGASVEATGYYRLRPPIKPVTLGEIAQMTHPNEPEKTG